MPVGGAAKGPRGPTSNFYMLPFGIRVLGLRTALSCKLAQVDQCIFMCATIFMYCSIALQRINRCVLLHPICLLLPQFVNVLLLATVSFHRNFTKYVVLSTYHTFL